MRVPKRRYETERLAKSAVATSKPVLITQAGLDKLKKDLESLEAKVPSLIADVEHTKSHGDFSENAAYQDAKRTLRSTYNRINSLKHRIKRAVLIERNTRSGVVELGSFVTVLIDNKQQNFQILGREESNPTKGVISNDSPLGELLIGKSVNDEFDFSVGGGTKHVKLIKVN